ncbi:MAG: MATE family efflux transporter, partial [Burkholderiales bacterium]|nr:MATE family efflux transporter [Burkholderiales bacterium]
MSEAVPAGVRLPAVRHDAKGRRRVDRRAVAALALPLMANSSLQLVLNLTDTWFIGHLSTDALAAMGAVHFLALVFLIALGGVGFVVQTLV